MNKTVKLILTKYNETLQPFIISNDTIEVGDIVCELLTNGEWFPMTIHTLNDIDINRQNKIIATSEQIGYIVNSEKYPNDFGFEEVETSLRLITLDDIEHIINDGGECSIETDEFHGDYCGYRTIKYKDNKVIIHLKDE